MAGDTMPTIVSCSLIASIGQTSLSSVFSTEHPVLPNKLDFFLPSPPSTLGSASASGSSSSTTTEETNNVNTGRNKQVRFQWALFEVVMRVCVCVCVCVCEEWASKLKHRANSAKDQSHTEPMSICETDNLVIPPIRFKKYLKNSLQETY